MADLCGPCAAARLRWLDYRLPPAPIRLDGTGIRTARDIAEYHRRRFEEWRGTVRFHMDLIGRQCAGGNHG